MRAAHSSVSSPRCSASPARAARVHSSTSACSPRRRRRRCTVGKSASGFASSTYSSIAPRRSARRTSRPERSWTVVSASASSPKVVVSRSSASRRSEEEGSAIPRSAFARRRMLPHRATRAGPARISPPTRELSAGTGRRGGEAAGACTRCDAAAPRSRRRPGRAESPPGNRRSPPAAGSQDFRIRSSRLVSVSRSPYLCGGIRSIILGLRYGIAIWEVGRCRVIPGMTSSSSRWRLGRAFCPIASTRCLTASAAGSERPGLQAGFRRMKAEGGWGGSLHRVLQDPSDNRQHALDRMPPVGRGRRAQPGDDGRRGAFRKARSPAWSSSTAASTPAAVRPESPRAPESQVMSEIEPHALPARDGPGGHPRRAGLSTSRPREGRVAAGFDIVYVHGGTRHAACSSS